MKSVEFDEIVERGEWNQSDRLRVIVSISDNQCNRIMGNGVRLVDTEMFSSFELISLVASNSTSFLMANWGDIKDMAVID